MHLKKSKMPKTWPIPRKGKRKRFVAVPDHATSKGITILYALRDLLKVAETRKEAKKIMLNGDVKVNTIIRKSDTFPIQVLDTLSLEKGKVHYRLEIENKKFKFKEISEKESQEKIVKILGKKVIDKKTLQMNLEDGSNFLSKENFSVGDSALLNLKTKKITGILPLKVGAKVDIVSGKHAGKKGKLVSIEELRRGKEYKIKLDDENIEVTLPYKVILVIG